MNDGMSTMTVVSPSGVRKPFLRFSTSSTRIRRPRLSLFRTVRVWTRQFNEWFLLAMAGGSGPVKPDVGRRALQAEQAPQHPGLDAAHRQFVTASHLHDVQPARTGNDTRDEVHVDDRAPAQAHEVRGVQLRLQLL